MPLPSNVSMNRLHRFINVKNHYEGSAPLTIERITSRLYPAEEPSVHLGSTDLKSRGINKSVLTFDIISRNVQEKMGPWFFVRRS